VEEYNPTNKSKEFENIGWFKIISFLKDGKKFFLFWILVLFFVAILICSLIYLYIKVSKQSLDDNQEQQTNQYINLTDEEKENILKSLYVDSNQNEMHLDNKRTELNSLYEQYKDDNLEKYQKMNILNQLGQ
jgi:hypothetical protein